jgi:hypothetical protein
MLDQALVQDQPPTVQQLEQQALQVVVVAGQEDQETLTQGQVVERVLTHHGRHLELVREVVGLEVLLTIMRVLQEPRRVMEAERAVVAELT